MADEESVADPVGLRLPAAADGFPRFFIRSSPPFGFALVPELLALGQGQFHLDPAVFEVHPRGNQGQALLLRFADELADLFAMHQQFAGAQRGMIMNVSMLIGADVGVQQPDGVVFDQSIGVFKVSQAPADRLYFGTCQNHPRLKFFQQEVVM